MKELKVFFSEIWKGFEAPEKPMRGELETDYDETRNIDKYNQAYAEAKRNALPVLNEEVIQQAMIYKNGLNDKPLNDYDYVWPGTWEVRQRSAIEMSLAGEYDKGPTHGYVLSLPEPVKPDEQRILHQAKEYQKNLPSGKREHFIGYIDGAMAELKRNSQPVKPESPKEEKHTTEKEVDYWATKWKDTYTELQSLRDQLAANRRDNDIYINAISYLKNQLKAKEAENRKLKEEVEEIQKELFEYKRDKEF
jgi:hypothetical protein